MPSANIDQTWIGAETFSSNSTRSRLGVTTLLSSHLLDFSGRPSCELSKQTEDARSCHQHGLRVQILFAEEQTTVEVLSVFRLDVERIAFALLASGILELPSNSKG